MKTTLLAATARLDRDAITCAIPPACRCEPVALSALTVGHREAVLELPESRLTGARHFVPSVCLLTPATCAARFELSAFVGGAWSAWIGSETIGGDRFAPLPASDRGITCDVDVYTAAEPCERVQLRVRLRTQDAGALIDAPCLVTLSACDLAPPPLAAESSPVAPIVVPPLSQMDAPAGIAARICSPTSLAMVLAYWGAPVSATQVAAEVFHAPTDRYGVWPAAIHAAGRRGVAGYLLRFPDWPSAAWCLDRGRPIIASIRYEAGELTGAAIGETSGHLVVLTGCDADHVFVNDPAAPTVATVRRRYRLAELQRVWLERTGVGYVLFRPDRSTRSEEGRPPLRGG